MILISFPVIQLYLLVSSYHHHIINHNQLLYHYSSVQVCNYLPAQIHPQEEYNLLYFHQKMIHIHLLIIRNLYLPAFFQIQNFLQIQVHFQKGCNLCRFAFFLTLAHSRNQIHLQEGCNFLHFFF